MTALVVLVGLISGLVASWVMERFQYAWWDVIAWWQRRTPQRASRPSAPAASSAPAPSDPSTVRVAAFFLCNLFGYDLPPRRKKLAGEATHYAFGTANGILYAVLVALFPLANAGFGLAFGFALWLVADELMLWGLRMAKRPTAYPLSIHVYALAAHLVYGASLEAAREILSAVVRT